MDTDSDAVTSWTATQQRTHNHASYARMDAVWFPEARKRGRKYKFTERQLAIAARVLAEQTKESER